LVQSGFYDFVNWFDQMSWYPLGRVVGGTVYPGIMVTAGLIHYVVNLLHFPIDIREVCVFLAPLFSALTAYATYLLTSEIKDSSAGLMAAAFIGIVPGYISRSVAGSYDNEAIAIFLLMITFYCWIKAQKTGSAFYGTLTALFYFWMVSAWGGYAFITNLVPLHVFALMLMGRYSSRLYVAYTSFYVTGTLSSMTIPFVGFQPTFTSEHMGALGIFGLIQIVAFVNFLKSHLSERQFSALFSSFIWISAILGVGALVGLTMAGYIAPWTGRFYSLFDTSYARKFIPIIASVSEHQPTPWTSFFFDLQLIIVLFPAGIYYCFSKLEDGHVFLILYAVFGSYFAGVMVRLMLTLTPVVCIASALVISDFLDTYLKNQSESTDEKTKKNIGSLLLLTQDTRLTVVFPMIVILTQFVLHCTWVTSTAYSSPSVVLASRTQTGATHIIDDFREAYYWLRENSDPQARIMSWWDYGYQITGMANRTVLVDNNTWNNTHIATVGKAMACAEDVSYEVMRRHDVDYVLVIFGGLLGYSGDDINKFLWMIRIGEGVYPNDINESAFFTPNNEYRVDDQATKTMRNSLLYKLSYYRFSEIGKAYGQAVDRARGQVIPDKPITLTSVDEVFTSENWLVRVYQVKKPDNIGRSLGAAAT
jgi:dolichyl-diphosphooligosaccharide--protein glycosyltransferase